MLARLLSAQGERGVGSIWGGGQIDALTCLIYRSRLDISGLLNGGGMYMYIRSTYIVKKSSELECDNTTYIIP